MVILGVSLCVLGISLIRIGTIVSLKEWNREQKRLDDARATKGVLTDAAGAGEVLTGVAKLADALRKHKLGMQLVFVGVALILLGAMIAGAAGFGK